MDKCPECPYWNGKHMPDCTYKKRTLPPDTRGDGEAPCTCPNNGGGDCEGCSVNGPCHILKAARGATESHIKICEALDQTIPDISYEAMVDDLDHLADKCNKLEKENRTLKQILFLTSQLYGDLMPLEIPDNFEPED